MSRAERAKPAQDLPKIPQFARRPLGTPISEKATG